MAYKNKADQKAFSAKHYRKNKAEYVARAAAYNRKMRLAIRKIILDLKKESRCVRCGFDDYRALQFHHLRDKEFNIGAVNGNIMTIQRVLDEIAKCELLCANCHAINHFVE